MQRSKLELERNVSARLRIAMDTQLTGEALGAQLRNLAEAGSVPPNWFQSMLETRNIMLEKANRRAERAEMERSAAEAGAREETKRLERRIADLVNELEVARSAAKATAPRFGPGSSVAPGLPSQRPPQRGGFRSAVAASLQRNAEPHVIAAPSPTEPLWEDDMFASTSSRHRPLPAAVQPPAEPVQPFNRGSRAAELDDDAIDLGGSDEDDLEVVSDSDIEGDAPGGVQSGSDALGRQKNGGTQVLVAAGPSKLGMSVAPGPSFIPRAELATTGLRDSAQYIQKGPDGRGGIATVFLRDGVVSSMTDGHSGRPPAPKRHKAASKGAAGTSTDLKISHFFNRK